MHLHTPLSTLMAEDHLADRRDARTFSRAMLLKGGPKSPQALAFVAWVVDEVVIPFKKSGGQLRPSMVLKYHAIAEAFLADLFAAAADGTWSKLATDNHHLVTVPGGKTAFGTMRAALGSAGLLEELPGYFRTEESFGVKRRRAARTCFRPSAKFLSVAVEQGVRLDDIPLHFIRNRTPPGAPEPPEVLRLVARKQGEDSKPKSLPFPKDDERALPIIEGLDRLNGYLVAGGRIAGIVFAGLRRSFNDADQPRFAYQWGGRYYSLPEADHYERMEGAKGTRQRVILIDGKPAREVDISASQLTILHGLLGVAFDVESDPYCFPEVSREDAKQWLLVVLGSSGEKHGGNRLKAAKEAGLGRYPFLRDLPTLGIGPLDLQYHEAEILRLAMEDMMSRGLGFLPVHDALLVAQGNQEIAAQAIRSAFHRYFTEHLGKPIAPVPRLKWDE